VTRTPYMPLFFGDFLASTADWEGEERSLYLTLLGYQWSLGSIPADPKRVCKLVGWDRELFDSCWPIVSSKFHEVEGRLFNGRLESHREKAETISAKRAESGKAGAAKRWQADGKCHDEHMANATDLQCHLIQSNPIHKKEEELSVPSGDVVRVFDHWKTVHGKSRSKLDDKRKKLIRGALKIYPAETLCQSIDGYKRSEFHQGKNDRRTVYDDIEIMLRDAKQIDAGIAYTNGGTQKWL
jgi:uncharacterized protein YdaU (DUF1376 family)